MMSSNFWYLDRDHTQRGPVAEDEFVRLIRQGVITPRDADMDRRHDRVGHGR